jgi:ribokinase
VAQTASAKGIMVILNPAPACDLPDSLLKNISIITPNETEAEMLSGVKVNSIDSAKKAAQVIKERGVDKVIVTLGSNGALILDDNGYAHVPGCRVNAIDTTAAGDVFNGALTVALADNMDLAEATRFACHAAAISVTRLGAQSSAPHRKELDTFLNGVIQ